MRKSMISALIGSVFALGSAHAGLMLDLNGGAAGGQINASALDWFQTSFLALGGNTAINKFAMSGGTCPVPADCTFDVLTHAKLTGFTDAASGTSGSLPAFGGEITMVARYTEKVTAFGLTAGGNPQAEFSSTGAGWIEFFYSAAQDSAALSGGGYNNGTLIGRLQGVQVGRNGGFTVFNTDGIALDGFGTDDYDGQLTVEGSGFQQSLKAGVGGPNALDPTFFLTALSDFTLNFQNISIDTPYGTTNPSDCFTTAQTAAAVGTSGLLSTCNFAHVDGLYSAQANPTGYTPVVGVTNGLSITGAPDFVAQTDFNSAVNGTVPEPGSLALVGLALAGLGFAARRRSV